MEFFNKCVICYFYWLKSILNDDSFREYINPVVFINLKYSYIKKSFFYQLVSTLYLLSALKESV